MRGLGWGVAIVVAPPAVLAGDVTVRVTSPAVDGSASPSDLAEVVAVDVAPSTVAGVGTVAVATLVNARFVGLLEF